MQPELPTSLPGSLYVIQGSSTAIEVSSSVGSNSPTSSDHELEDPAHVPDVRSEDQEVSQEDPEVQVNNPRRSRLNKINMRLLKRRGVPTLNTN